MLFLVRLCNSAERVRLTALISVSSQPLHQVMSGSEALEVFREYPPGSAGSPHEDDSSLWRNVSGCGSTSCLTPSGVDNGKRCLRLAACRETRWELNEPVAGGWGGVVMRWIADESMHHPYDQIVLRYTDESDGSEIQLGESMNNSVACREGCEQQLHDLALRSPRSFARCIGLPWALAESDRLP